MDELRYIAPVRAVYGNCDDWDIRREVPESLVFPCEGHKVAIMHIVGNGNYYSTPALDLIAAEKPTILVVLPPMSMPMMVLAAITILPLFQTIFYIVTYAGGKINAVGEIFHFNAVLFINGGFRS